LIKVFDKDGNLLANTQEDYTTVSMAKGQLSTDMVFATLSANNLVNLYRITKDKQKGEDGQAFEALQITKLWSIDVFESIEQS